MLGGWLGVSGDRLLPWLAERPPQLLMAFSEYDLSVKLRDRMESGFVICIVVDILVGEKFSWIGVDAG